MRTRKRSREIRRSARRGALSALQRQQEFHREIAWREHDYDMLTQSRKAFDLGERGAFVIYLHQPPKWNKATDLIKSKRFSQEIIEALLCYDPRSEYVVLFYPIAGAIHAGYLVQEWYDKDSIDESEYTGVRIARRFAGDPRVRDDMVEVRVRNRKICCEPIHEVFPIPDIGPEAALELQQEIDRLL